MKIVPTRLARQGMDAVKRRARRRDLLGYATYLTLSAVHDGFGTVAQGLERLAEASEPPARGGARGRQQRARTPRARTPEKRARRREQARGGAKPSTPSP